MAAVLQVSMAVLLEMVVLVVAAMVEIMTSDKLVNLTQVEGEEDLQIQMDLQMK